MSIEVEQAVLGAVLNNPETITGIATLSPADFYEVKHQKVWATLLAQWGENKPIDPVTTFTALQNSGNADLVGGAPYLFELSQMGAIPAALPSHIETLRDVAARRRLAWVGHEIREAAKELSAVDALAKSQALLDGVLKAESDGVKTVGDTIDATLDQIMRVSNGEVPKSLSTGFYDLDRITGGFRGGQMIIVGARPGVGKTTIGADFMRHASMRLGVPSMLFSLEMNKDEINQRLLAAEAEVLVENIRSGKLQDDDWARLAEARDRLAVAKMHIDDFAEMTIVDIIAKTKMFVKQHNVGLVVVDYIQLLRTDGKVESRQQEVAGYSRQLKLLAKSCDIPVVVIAQVKRPPEGRGEDAKLKLSDLRESGALEQDADMVIFINRPDSENKDHARAGEADIDVAKNRGGPTNTAVVASQLHYSKFVNLSKEFR